MAFLHLKLVFVVLVTVCYVTAQPPLVSPPAQVSVDVDVPVPAVLPALADNPLADIGATFVADLLNSGGLQKKLRVLFGALDLKARLFKILKSAITRENLILTRRTTDWVIRLMSFLNEFLPGLPAEEPLIKTNFLGAILSAQAPGDANAGSRSLRNANEKAIEDDLNEDGFFNDKDTLQAAGSVPIGEIKFPEGMPKKISDLSEDDLKALNEKNREDIKNLRKLIYSKPLN